MEIVPLFWPSKTFRLDIAELGPSLSKTKKQPTVLQPYFILLQPLGQCGVEYAIHHERDVRDRNRIHMWREQAIIEQHRREISVVACCHSGKLCALADRAFRSFQINLCLIKKRNLLHKMYSSKK